jgi:hypothetical protein
VELEVARIALALLLVAFATFGAVPTTLFLVCAVLVLAMVR